MGKSVYSLVLSDEVMKQIDRVADKKGESRSGLVNRILAEYVSYETPEQKTRDIFAAVEELLETHDSLRFLSKATGSMATVKSALIYKYKPTVKYTVELYAFSEKSPFLGELKVSSRTSNELLKSAIEDFFRLWVVLEKKYIFANLNYSVEDGRFRRVLFKPDGEYTSENLGKIITEYIDVFDTLIKQYFSNLDNLQYTIKKLEDNFRKAFYGKPLI